MNRRDMLCAAAGSAVALSAVATGRGAEASAADRGASQPAFRLKYAPHFDMFANLAGSDLVDQLEFAADQGFRAWEDNRMAERSLSDQERVAQAMQRLGIEMGTVSALGRFGYETHFSSDDADIRQRVIDQIGRSVEVARRVNARWMTLVLGKEHAQLPWDVQTANAIDLLKRACDVVEPHGITLIMEPLNRAVNHAGVFLHRATQGYLLAKAVDRPGCKLLFDIYHEQIAEGDIVRNIDRTWDQIAYMQCADNPGRKEPGTGEINYAFVFQHIANRGFDGIMGLEHGNSSPGPEGDQAVIDAYRAVDPRARPRSL